MCKLYRAGFNVLLRRNVRSFKSDAIVNVDSCLLVKDDATLLRCYPQLC
jgi:hypothetical protein